LPMFWLNLVLAVRITCLLVLGDDEGLSQYF
jgi:hypothetical protein